MRCARLLASCALLCSRGAAARADGIELALRGGSGSCDYRVTLEGDLLSAGLTLRLEAGFEASWRALSAEDDGSIPVVLTLGEGGGSYVSEGRVTELAWSYDGARCLLRYGPDSIVRETVIPLDPAAQAPSMDALAAYLAMAWWVPRPAHEVAEGDSWLRDVEAEPGLTGPALVDRRVLARVERVAEVDGRQVVFLEAEIETRLRDDHPTLSGSAVVEARVALDAETGELLAAKLVETGEAVPRDGSPPLRTEGLVARIALADGPEIPLD